MANPKPKASLAKDAKPKKSDAKEASPAAPEFVLKMSHLMDTGLMYIIPYAFGLYMGHDPIRLVIGFVLQSLVFVFLTVTVYGPFYPSSFYRAWDLVYRYQDLKTDSVMTWDSTPTVDVSTVKDAPPPNSIIRWLIRLVLRKGSGFHLLVSLSSIDSAFFAIPLVTMVAYYLMMVDKTGISDIAGLYGEIQKMLTPEAPKEPMLREETLDEIDERQLKEIREGLDTTFSVGAPVAAASLMVWWLGERGKSWTMEAFGF
ncbi:UNVERIFIED_CONTAM: hypothetical protein HDU68_000316 [Siphonaria sp. JEL0065]|nr:hypothetical protein HDU68_000316 [Siphonaria sp. JEL0065]